MQAFLKSNRTLLRHFIKPCRLSIVCATLFSLVLGVTAAMLAVMVGPALRLLMDVDSSKTLPLSDLFGTRLSYVFSFFFESTHLNLDILLAKLPPLLLGIAFLKLLLGTSQYYLWERASEIMTKGLRQCLNDSFLAIHPSLRRYKHHEEREATLSSLITTDVKLVREYLVHFYGGLPREILQIVFIGQTLVLLSPKLCAIFFFGVLPAIVLIQNLGRKLKKRAQLALQDYSDLTEWLQQRLLGVETIKHYKTEALESQKMEIHSEELLKKFLRAARAKARTGPILEFIGITAMALVLFVAFRDIEHLNLQASVAVSFFTGLALVAQSGNRVGRYINSNREGAAALERVRSFLQELEKEKIGNPSVSYPLESEEIVLRLKHIQATYPASSKKALEDISFDFHRGKIYCIKGHSGSGKSTLFNIILGNLIPSSGEVLFNKSVEQVGLGYLPQNVQFFYGTIADNVIYPDNDADLVRLETSLRAVDLWEHIFKQEQRSQTLIGGGGVELSGGQSQRIHIARILYHNYPLILIDEGTSALDPINENLICNLLTTKAKEGACIIMISHRLAPLQYADEILNLDSGRIEGVVLQERRTTT
jgi:subfamily B ATP-binding cassette protein MsbA